jgi:hypothetical protein
MVSDGSCGHHPMIWRPSDMVSVVDRPIDELIVVCCARKSTVLLYVPHKKILLRQTKIQRRAAHFFQPLTK